MGRRRKPAAIPLPPPSPTTPTPLLAPPNTPDGVAQPSSLPPLPIRRQPVLLSRPAPRSRGARCAEVAGNTAADCAAVCCCCPCGILNLVVLAVVKLPAGLCRRAFLKQKRKKKMRAPAGAMKEEGGSDGASDVSSGATRQVLLGPNGDADEDESDDDFIVFGLGGPVVVGSAAMELLLASAVGWPAEKSPSAEISEMDKEMWAHFYGTGFWRSPSQKEV